MENEIMMENGNIDVKEDTKNCLITKTKKRRKKIEK